MPLVITKKQTNNTVRRATQTSENLSQITIVQKITLLYDKLHEFGLQELKIYEMEAEISPDYLTFKERGRIWETEK